MTVEMNFQSIQIRVRPTCKIKSSFKSSPPDLEFLRILVLLLALTQHKIVDIMRYVWKKGSKMKENRMKIFQCVPVFFRLSIRAEIEEKYTRKSQVTHLKK